MDRALSLVRSVLVLCRRRIVCSPTLTFLLALGVLTGPARAIDIAEALKRPLLESGTTLEEVQQFTESRVLPMPELTTVAAWERFAEQMRQDTLDRVVFRGKAAQWRAAEPSVQWQETLEGGKGYRIRKLRFQALPGLWIPALLYEPLELSGKVPVVLNVNGHDGKGKAADYKQIRCINQAKRGMLALNVEWLGMGQLRTPGLTHYKMNQLDLCGTSGLAPFYLSMSRGLDVLLSHEHADPKRVAVAGLSGGGWQTIFISSLDSRVTLSDPVAGYSSFRTRARNLSDLGDSEQTPSDLGTVTDYALLTALRAPRPTLLTFNAHDNCCFKADHALPPLLDAAGPVFDLYGKPENLRAHVNFEPGTHNFEQDNREALYRMLGDHFFTGDADYDPAEIPSEDEVRTAEELHVQLPGDNADFHTLALQVMQELPSRHSETAESPEDARNRLRKVVAARDYDVDDEVASEEKSDGLAIRWHRYRFGSDWTVPAVEFTPAGAQGTTIVLSDKGRAESAATVESLVKSGRRVVAVDPFYFGESRIPQRDFLFGLLVAAVGERPLGLQASQILGLARSLPTGGNRRDVCVMAIGPRTSLMALVAAALDAEAITALKLVDSYASLRTVIEQDLAVNQMPELFCFGLLRDFDIPLMRELVEPRTVDTTSAAR